LQSRYLKLGILIFRRRLVQEYMLRRTVRLIILLLALVIRALREIELEAYRRVLLMCVILALRLGIVHQ
jgi:hypothetical protein